MVHFIFCYLFVAILVCPFVMLIMMEMAENKGRIKNWIASYKYERHLKKYKKWAENSPFVAHELTKCQEIDISSLNKKDERR